MASEAIPHGFQRRRFEPLGGTFAVTGTAGVCGGSTGFFACRQAIRSDRDRESKPVYHSRR